MAYDPLAPYLPLGSTLTPDHISHLDRGIQDVEEYVDRRVLDLQAGAVTPEAIDVGIDRAVDEGRIPTGGDGVAVSEIRPAVYEITSNTTAVGRIYGLTPDQTLPTAAKADLETTFALKGEGGSGEGGSGSPGRGVLSISDPDGDGVATVAYTDGTTEELVLPPGTPGADGRSAYQIAQDEGFTGSKTEWVASLKGAPGAAASVAVGTTTTGAAGSSASVTNTGTGTNAVLNFTVPRGATGASASITGASATGLSAGAAPTVTMGGTSTARTFTFGIPAGPQGPVGVITSETPPANPLPGQVWVDTSPLRDLTQLPGILGSWRAEDLTHLTTGQSVQYVPSRVGLGSPLIQMTSSNRPTLDLTAAGGRPALRFVKTSSQSMEAPLPTVSGPLTVISAFKCNSNESTIYSSGDAKYVSLFYGASSFASMTNSGTMLTTPGDLGWNIVVQVIDGASSRVYWSSLTASAWSITDQSAVGFQDALRVGNNSSTMYSNMLLAEIALYNRGLSDGEVREVFYELGPKYGLVIQ